jgi:hypothetical protein
MKKSFLSVAAAALMFAACNDKENFTPETIEKDDTVVKEINTRQVTNAQAQKFSEAFAHCFSNSNQNGWYVVDGKWSSDNYTTSKIMYTNLTR